MRKYVLSFLLPLLLAGCAARSAYDRARVSDTLEGRTGHPLRAEAMTVGTETPAGVVLEDGLTPDEAVALALWNNAAFQADLAELGLARADLRDAGLLRNPLLTLLFPLGPKQFEATLNLPIDLIWQRPKRVAAATFNVERVASNLVDHGLDLARAVLAAHAGLDLARARAGILRENALVLKEIAELTAARERAGDISGLEGSAARLQAARAAEDAVAAVRDAELAEENLRTLVGLGIERLEIRLAAGPAPPDGPGATDDLLAGCAARSAYDRARVSDTLEGRTGHPLRAEAMTVGTETPAGVVLEDGLTPDEAVALALWNNAAFQADLAELGLARADLRDAGLLRNPLLTLLFPLGPKQFEATLNLPIDLIWQRPKRVAAATLNVERVASNLVDHGLDLARAVLAAHAGLDLARARAGILQENALVLKEIAELTAARERAGDISGLEGSAARLQAVRAAEDAVAAVRDAELAEENLRTLVGLGIERLEIRLADGPPPPAGPGTTEDLLAAAYAFRPTLRASELAIEAAGKRLGWEQSRVFNLIGLVDVNGAGKEGFEMGPGLQVELPLFNQNQGKTARAREEMTQALHLYEAEKQRIAREVRDAASRYVASREALDIVSRDLLPAAALAAAGAEKSCARGAISYLGSLEYKRRWLEARLREADDIAQLRRAEADLRYSIGFKPMASGKGD